MTTTKYIQYIHLKNYIESLNSLKYVHAIGIPDKVVQNGRFLLPEQLAEIKTHLPKNGNSVAVALGFLDAVAKDLDNVPRPPRSDRQKQELLNKLETAKRQIHAKLN